MLLIRKRDAEEIEPVDTSNMGKIGKMAHIMATMAANAEDEEEGRRCAGGRDKRCRNRAGGDFGFSGGKAALEAEAVPEPEIVTAAEADHTDL